MAQQNQEQNLSISREDLQAAITAAVVTAVQEMKKPSEEEAQAAAEKKARLLANQKASADEQMERKRQEDANQLACGHMKAPPYSDQHTLNGQIHGDGLFHPICRHCGKEFDPFPPGKDTLPFDATLGADEWKRLNPKMIAGFGKRFKEQQLVTA